MSRLSVRLLGPFGVTVDGQATTGFRTDKVRALLAYLAVESDTPHRRERLAGLLWPDWPERSARAHLRVALADLRKVTGDHQATPPHFLISRQTIQFNQGSDAWVDAASLKALLQTSRPTIDLLEEALDLYQGEFMAGFSLADSRPFEEWAVLTREQLHRMVLEALDRLATALEQRGEYERALVHAWRQVDLDPWREVAHRHVMRLLARTGQRSAALAQFHKCQEVLAQELGVEVSEQTRQLYEELERGEGPPGVAPQRARHNLPVQATSFEGREAELAAIDKLLRDPSCRLLTLLGPGGIGKTRLALEAARQKATSHEGSVYFVPLAHISSPEFVVSTVAHALGITVNTESSELDPKTQLLDYLGERSVLLLMDSFEHLVEGSGLLVEVLEQAPNVRFLVTSRERLRLQGEWIFEVQGLRYPENGDGAIIDDYEAVQLFVARARQADSRFTLSAAERPHASTICRLVGGMPLGIELAAAWVPVLSCQEIADEIGQGLDILATSMRDLPSLRAAFDHSWNLLAEDIRSGFRKLSVFRGGFSRGAALEVAGIDLAMLSELVNRSLLRRNAEGRYEIHELLRQYAAEKLNAFPGERQAVQARHSRYYVEFLAGRERDLFGEGLRAVKREIRVDMENVRVAVHYAVAHWSEGEARDALARFDAVHVVEGWHEGKESFADVVQGLREPAGSGSDSGGSPRMSAMAYQALYASLLGESDVSEELLQTCLPALRVAGCERELAVCHFGRGVNAIYRGEHETSIDQFSACISLAGAGRNVRWVANGLMWWGWVLSELGDYEGALARLQESYDLYEGEGNRWGMAFVLSKLGLVADGQKDYARGKRTYQEALEILEGFGDRAGQAYTTSRMSLTAYAEGRYAEAQELGRRGYDLFKELGHRWGMGASLCRIGFADLGLGRRREAESCFHEALELAAGMQHVPLILYGLAGKASLLAEEGEEARAVELLTFVEQHPQTPPIYLVAAGRWFSDIETRLPPDALAAAGERGRAGELEVILEEVLEGRPLG